jgi:hypothetical protein
MNRGSFRCISLSTYDRPAPHPLLDLFHSLSPAYPASYPPYSGRLANRQSANSPRIPQPLPLSQTADQETIHPIIPSPARRRAVKPVKTRIERQRVAIFMNSEVWVGAVSPGSSMIGCQALSRRLARKRVLISARESETQIICTHVVYLASPTLILGIRPITSTRLLNHDEGCAPARTSRVAELQVGHLGRFRSTRVLAIPSVCQDSLGTRTPK